MPILDTGEWKFFIFLTFFQKKIHRVITCIYDSITLMPYKRLENHTGSWVSNGQFLKD